MKGVLGEKALAAASSHTRAVVPESLFASVFYLNLLKMKYLIN